MREWVDQLFAVAGIEPGGTHPWDIQIHDPAFYPRVWSGRNLGLGESYVDGWWDSPRLDEFFARLLRSKVEEGLRLTPGLALRALAHRFFNWTSGAAGGRWRNMPPSTTAPRSWASPCPCRRSFSRRKPAGAFRSRSRCRITGNSRARPSTGWCPSACSNMWDTRISRCSWTS